MGRAETIKSAFESMLFVWGEPLDCGIAADVFNIDKKEAYLLFKELQEEYADRSSGIRIREIDKTFQLCTFEGNDEYINRLCTPVREKRLTQSAMEVLAIIAYKQPVTKGEIESIRGIKCDRVIEGLIKKELIEEVGRSPGIGRPILYGTTMIFLKNFGFTNLSDLPQMEDISDVIRDAEDNEEKDALQITLDLDER